MTDGPSAVAVAVRTGGTRPVPDVLAELVAAGLDVTHVLRRLRVVEGRVAPERLDRLAAVPDVTSVTPDTAVHAVRPALPVHPQPAAAGRPGRQTGGTT